MHIGYFTAFSGFFTPFKWTLPQSSVGKESTCNAGDPSSIPGSGRSPGEGLGYPLQYSWTSVVAQLVKNPPAMWETWVRSLSWEDPLEKGTATYSSILAWRIPWTVQSMGSQRVGHDWATFISLHFPLIKISVVIMRLTLIESSLWVKQGAPISGSNLLNFPEYK